MSEEFGRSLQENLLTLLCHSDEHGGLVAQIANSELFEGDYKIIARRTIDYWREYKCAPKMHTTDLFADILESPGNKRASSLRRTLTSAMQLSEGINAVYVVQQLRLFIYTQSLKAGIIELAEVVDRPQGVNLEEAGGILNRLLRIRTTQFDRGTRLNEYDRLLQIDVSGDEFDFGIPILDSAGIVPNRGKLLNFLAATGKGKTWALVHLGKRAYLRRKRVAHITVEDNEVDVQRRYYQSLFAIPKRTAEAVDVTTLELDQQHYLSGTGSRRIKPDYSFMSPDIRAELETRVDRHGGRLGNVIIKHFPERSLTMDGLRGYLDMLEQTENFIPDLLILDYPGKMKLNIKDYRLALGMVYSEFRGLLQERNMAGAVAHQTSKEGATARTVTGLHVAEDFSVIQTCDTVITYSQTKEEQQFGLARLFVDKARAERGKFSLIITQAYPIGQFVLDSARMSNGYFEYIDGLSKRQQDDDEPADNDDIA